MDYKTIFRNRALRLWLLRLLSFVPDKPMIRLQYRIKTGRRLNLKAPVRYSEKLQWYKLFYRDPAMVPCVDKYDVRAYVAQKGLGHILNGCLGVYDSADAVDFAALPERFVIKDTLGCGGASVIPVTDKAGTDLSALRSRMAEWTRRPYRLHEGGREWPYYSGKKHRIIIEEYLEEDFGGLTDYKFICFGGRVTHFYVHTAFARDRSADRMTYYDRDLHPQPGVSVDYCTPAADPLPLPDDIGRMIEYAEQLSAGFPHVRVDLYHVGGRIIFGELTFFHASGYLRFDPDEYDTELGSLFTLPEKNA